jgi:hypothetical protein
VCVRACLQVCVCCGSMHFFAVMYCPSSVVVTQYDIVCEFFVEWRAGFTRTVCVVKPNVKERIKRWSIVVNGQ